MRWVDSWRRRGAGAKADVERDAGVRPLQRARALVVAGRFEPALTLLRSLDDVERAQPAVQLVAGAALAHMERPVEALGALRAGAADAWVDAASCDMFVDALARLGTGDEVEAMARQIVERTAFTARAGIVLGRCCLARGAPRDAEAWLRRALEQDASTAVAWTALGLALRQQDRDAEALVAYEAAERITAAGGDDVAAFADVAYMLQRMGRLQDARDVLEAGLASRPAVAAHRSYAEVLLSLGEFSEGFEHYEFRWMAEPLAGSRLGPVRPPWLGQALAGRTILLRVEQGYGDTFQFLRYVEHVKQLGATIVMRRFSDLVDAMPHVDIALRDHDPVPHFDYYANLGSLPRIFGTTLATIPASTPYLRVPAERRAAWRERIATYDGLNVGLAWAGNALPDPRRSLALAELRPLLDVAGVRFFALQKGVPDAEVTAATAGRVQPLGSHLADFGDTAAAIEALDLVISIDTSVAHLAGALGKPVWTMLVRNADWRWLVDREDSPWYPTMRLFRQERRGEWGPVIERVVRALGDVAGHRSTLALPGRRPDAVVRIAFPASLASPVRRASRFARVDETRHGIVHHRGDDSTESIGLRCYGEHAQAELASVERMIGPGSVVVSVAPGAGTHALARAAILGPSGHQWLVEPRAFERTLLRQTLVANRAAGAATLLDALPADDEGLPEALGLARLDVLTIGDTADAARTIAACEALIWRFRPAVFASLPDERAVTTLVEALRKVGYCAWRIEAPLFNPQNFYGRADDAFDGRRALTILAGPEESARPLLDEAPLLAY